MNTTSSECDLMISYSFASMHLKMLFVDLVGQLGSKSLESRINT